MELKFLRLCLFVSLSSFGFTASGVQGDFLINGNNKYFGPYSGQGVVTGDEVVRVIKYDKRWNDLEILSVWSGSTDGGKTAVFKLNSRDYIADYEGPKLFWPPFVQNQSLILELDFENQKTYEFDNSIETWTPESNQNLLLQLGKSEIYSMGAFGQDEKIFVSLARKLGLDQVFKAYQNWAKKNNYAPKGEDAKAGPQRVRDFTDLEFYQNNSGTVKINNKLINELALLESLNRMHAFASTPDQKAKYFEGEIEKFNLSEFGLLEIALTSSERQKIGSELEGDAALWTGVYVWLEFLRYQQEKDGQGLLNAQRAIKGLINLIAISADPAEFARTAIKSPPNAALTSENKLFESRLKQGQGRFENYKWLTGGNNDMIKGVLFAFTVGAKYLPQNDPLRSEIASTLERLERLKAVSGREFNLGLVYGLKALYFSSPKWTVEASHFLNNGKTLFADGLDLDSGFYYKNIADWSGVHLSLISTLCQLFIGQELEKTMPRRSNERFLAAKLKGAAEDRLFEMAKTYRHAHRDFLQVAALALLPPKKGGGSLPSVASESAKTLIEFPAPRFIEGVKINHTLRSDWVDSPWPQLPWKLVGGFRKVKPDAKWEEYRQGFKIYPLFESLTWTSTYVWKDNPFRVSDQSPKNKIYFSVDYLFLYRLSREAGLLNVNKN